MFKCSQSSKFCNFIDDEDGKKFHFNKFEKNFDFHLILLGEKSGFTKSIDTTGFYVFYNYTEPHYLPGDDAY